MMKKKIDVLSFGSCYVDINAFNTPLSSSLSLEEELVVEEYEMVAGGSAVNSARAFSNFGMKVGFIGKTGKDEQGKILEKLLLKIDVEPFLIKSRKVSTNIGVNLTNEDGRTLMIVLGNANQSLSSKEVEKYLLESIDDTKFLYLGGIFKLKNISVDFYLEIVKEAKKRGVRVILDHGRITNITSNEDLRKIKQLVETLSNKDWYLPSENEFLKVWGGKNLKDSLKTFGDKNIPVIIKRAEKGSMSISEGEVIEVPAYKITPLNSVGAGDMFNAAFVIAKESGKNLEESLEFANAAAAIKISKNVLPTFEEVEQFVKDN